MDEHAYILGDALRAVLVHIGVIRADAVCAGADLVLAAETFTAHPLPQGRPGREATDAMLVAGHVAYENSRGDLSVVWRAMSALAFPPAVSAEDVARVIRAKVRLEWHGYDSATINYRSVEDASAAILALFSPAPITADAGKGES